MHSEFFCSQPCCLKNSTTTATTVTTSTTITATISTTTTTISTTTATIYTTTAAAAAAAATTTDATECRSPLACSTGAAHWSRSYGFRLQFQTSISFRFFSTESSHLISRLPTRLVPTGRFRNIAKSDY